MATPDKPKVWWVNGEGNIEGRCKKCGAEIRAMGLIPIQDKVMWGKWKQGGWYCADCKPREFGRIGGKPSMGVPISPGFVPPIEK